MSASRAANVRSLASIAALVLASAGCGRDFDGLFADGGKSSGDNGSSGTSGTPPDECTCKPCVDGTSCDLACPKDCKPCTCDVTFKCLAEKCDVDCGPGTSCDVICGDKASCAVSCEDGAQCACSGSGCLLTCQSGEKQACSTGAACSRDCPK